MQTIRVGGFFSGIGAHHSACERIASEGIQFKFVFQCEYDEKTKLAYDHLHGLVGDMG